MRNLRTGWGTYRLVVKPSLVLIPLLSAFMVSAAPVWLDDDWNIVKSEDQASYYLTEPLAENNGKWPVTVYFQGGDIVNFKGSLNSGDISTGKSVGEYEIYYDNGQLMSSGRRNAKGEYEGLTKFYNEEGVLTQEGTFVAGKEQGMGRLYYASGGIEEEYTILDGHRVGGDVHFYEDGSVWQKHRFASGKTHGIQETFYRDGSLRQKSHYVMGMRHGEYTSYYENGQVSYHINYVNDQPSGLGRSYHEDGLLYLEIAYENGKKNGLERGWHTKEQLRFEKHNLDGRLHGVATNYYPSGNKKSVENYNKGNRRGEQIEFYDQVDLVKSKRVFNSQGRKTSEMFLAEDGNKTFDYLASFQKDHQITDAKTYRDGTLTIRRQEDTKKKWQLDEEFDSQGKVIQRLEYVNGKRENAYIVMDSYNDSMVTTHYKKGVPNGVYLIESTSGELIESGTYLKGKRTGLWQYFYNGIIHSENYNRQGKLHGEVAMVEKESGKRVKWEHYRNGILHGDTENYSQYGTLLAKGKYVDGKRDGPWLHQEDYEPDVVIWSGTYDKGNKVGAWFAHSEAGYELGREQFDQQGRRQGAFYYFAEHGALKRIVRFVDDEQNGETEYYSTNGKIYPNDDSVGLSW
ncbi:hypothetical protein AB4520_06000 [Vibrio renipiscarius]|uniref:toxin-antitoxin system YwqK family antitoxin n=2 Tax=Vibrio renipiscarius TaxID=1461322 RepID=UPI00354CD78E